MYFRVVVLYLLLAVSCSPYSRVHRIVSGEIGMGLSVPSDEREEEDTSICVDSIRTTLLDGPVIMNAIRDDETGEMVATDVIRASKVTARFRNVAERMGLVTISFEISVPSAMSDSRWQLRICPDMYIQNDTLTLDPVFITGTAYRERQLRGYDRYESFLSGIITDSTDLLWMRQLEIFIERNSEEMFDVTPGQAMEHYRRHLRIWKNDRKTARSDEMFRRYVKDPIMTDGIKLDTVMVGDAGDFVYRYTHVFRSRPGLKKVIIALSGSIYEMGEKLLELPVEDDLTFYISTLATLADERPRYRNDSSELDTVYMCGVKALVELDYKAAVTILRPYDDYNTALAYVAADYNHTALDVLNRQDDTDARVCYLKAMVLSRLGQHDEAEKYLRLAIAYDPYMEHRANLDPEMYQLVKKE